MISPIGSGYSSPVSIQIPDSLSEIQDSLVASSGSEKKTGIKKGIANYQDSFELATPRQHQQPNRIQPQNPNERIENQSKKVAEADDTKKNYFRLSLNNDQIDENGYRWMSRYEKMRMVIESQKTEQANAFRPNQPGVVQMKPMIDPVANMATLTADLTANMLSMIRV